ncbi:hypothetical protein COY91_02350 [Candidatus Shapirobacteria bacterium CG_4_10_14_0_8_um_filter_39_15]|nr:MAG: hypothetical protein COY91_02350 [Candidatus Shapirobacteria bacterium CG_4_10_14_0_8_um_filter_39_15]PJE68208.1 MAG: hypothetical protein COU94_03045 [Candidatus Shapirobacteria bacterium CG10_big_fil_rev_8_21_14_0_10_38_8]
MNSSGNPVTNNPVVRNQNLDSNWSFPVNSVTAAGGIVTLDLSAIYVSTTGYTNNSFEELGTIYLKINSVPTQNPKILQFDLSQTKMLLKSNSSNILSSPTNGSYTINGGGGTAVPIATQPPMDSCPRGSLGNLNCDTGGIIDATDLNILLTSWGAATTPTSGRHTANIAPGTLDQDSGYS